MKSIVFVIESLHLGGAEKSLVTLLQNLDYSKYSVDLITFHPNGFFKEFVPKQVNHIVLPFPQLSLIDRLRYAWKRKTKKNFHHAQLFWALVSRYFSKVPNRYDIAVAYNQGFATYFVNSFVLSEKKYAWLNTDYQKAGYNIDFDFPVYHNFDKIVVVSSEAHQSFFNALSGINRTLPVEIIKDISDAQIIREQAALPLKVKFDKTKINLLSVGRLVQYKGFELAIDACKILKEKSYPVNWYIVGEGWERQTLQQKINDAGLSGCFQLLGADANPYPYIKACDIYAQTSLFEGLGLTVIEASLLNKPIVCTNFPTAFGILKPEETGLIAEMNPESIAHQIERLINDESLRKKLSDNLSKQENTDKERTLEKIEKLFNV